MQEHNTPIMSFFPHSHHHYWKHSGELDVFDAKQYFSGEVDHKKATRVERKSLDMPLESIINSVDNKEKKATTITTTNNNKCNNKQSSSPSGRLASFLNSLFQQYSSSSSSTKKNNKKKKASLSKPTSKSEGESEGSKKRRSMRCDYSKSCYFASSSSSSSSFSSHLHSKKTSSSTTLCQGFDGEEIKTKMKKKVEDIEGESSDSSSDLFELKNIYDEFDKISCGGLPVYRRTNVGIII